MADNAEGFDRAPGAGRSRGQVRGSGQGDSGRPREPELADGEALFNRCQPLRQPRTPPVAPPDSSLSSAAAVKPRPDQSAVFQSRLSAHAPEFIPSSSSSSSSYTPVQDVVYEEDDYYEDLYPEFSLADLVQDILSHLNSSPGSFETDIGNITSTLNIWVTTQETLHELVELIFTQSTSMPNFSYTGARLCNFLSHHLTLSPSSGNFRQLLLQRCRTEFNKRQEALMADEETQKKFHTYVLFLGELYLNLEVKSVKGTMSRAEILLTALKDLMDTLFSLPKDNNLICAVKLLKSDVRQMLLKLVELRSSNWGRVHAAAAYSEATPDNDPNYYMNEPTFYTADGTPFTAADPEYSEKYQEILEREDYFPEFYEENENDVLSAEEDEMEPEIEEAFEKFCLETERQKP
ncbi:polyadenylate-binding protein-interacting protein 1 [Silurus meridionalis]|nr:polyadenylate-binding protein-interacting protein 1 [Silurus meridionalis]